MNKWSCAFCATMLLAAGSGIYNIYQNQEIKKLRKNTEQVTSAYNYLRDACLPLNTDFNPYTFAADKKQQLEQLDSLIAIYQNRHAKNQKEIGSIKNEIRSKLLFPSKFDEMSEQGLLNQAPYMSAQQRQRITQLNREITSYTHTIDSLCTVRHQNAIEIQSFIDSVFTAQQPIIEKIKEISK